MFLDARACFQPLRGVCARLKRTAGLQSESSSLSLPLPLCLSASACAPAARGKCFYPDSSIGKKSGFWEEKPWMQSVNNQCVKRVTYYTDYTHTVFEAETVNICTAS